MKKNNVKVMAAAAFAGSLVATGVMAGECVSTADTYPHTDNSMMTFPADPSVYIIGSQIYTVTQGTIAADEGDKMTFYVKEDAIENATDPEDPSQWLFVDLNGDKGHAGLGIPHFQANVPFNIVTKPDENGRIIGKDTVEITPPCLTDGMKEQIKKAGGFAIRVNP